MLERGTMRGFVGVSSLLGILIPITLLIRTPLFPMHLFGLTELLLYPGSIFLFDESPHSPLYDVAMLTFTIMVTVALYALAAMIVYGIFRGVVYAWRFVQRRRI